MGDPWSESPIAQIYDFGEHANSSKQQSVINALLLLYFCGRAKCFAEKMAFREIFSKKDRRRRLSTAGEDAIGDHRGGR